MWILSAPASTKIVGTIWFSKTPHDDTVIVPNYFEPFERKQIEIRFMMNRESFDGFRMVKGDSDRTVQTL